MRARAAATVLAIILACPAAFSDGGGPEWDSEIEESWQRQLDRGGCMLGSQDWNPIPSTELRDHAAMSDCSWEEFLARDRNALAAFLFTRLESDCETGYHVCPLGFATEGEMAVYALQHLTYRNWDEIESTAPVFRDAHALVAEGRHQFGLRKVLEDPAGRAALTRFFQKRLAEI